MDEPQTIDDLAPMEYVQFREFLSKSFGLAIASMAPGAAFYIWHADLESYNFMGAVKDAGEVVRQCLIWTKNTMVMGRQDYHWQLLERLCCRASSSAARLMRSNSTNDTAMLSFKGGRS